MTLVIIPSRMGSTRLPGKPLLKIGDRTIIRRCVEQAMKAGLTPCVATDSEEIRQEVWSHSTRDGLFLHETRVVITGDCASGTDRVAAAAEIIDPEGKHEFVINYQGDMPFLDPKDLGWFCWHMEELNNQLQTAYCEIDVVEVRDDGFARKKVESHIGLYGFSRQKLREFAKTPQSTIEKLLGLEQCRLPFDDWEIVPFKTMPIEINTQADLDRARSCLM